MTNSRKIDIQRIIRLKGMDGFLITDIKNVRYISGFTGSSGFVIVTRDKCLFYADFRYKEQAHREVKDFEIGIEKGKRINLIQNIVKRLGIKILGFEKSASYEFYELLKKLPATLMPKKNIMEDLRKIKNEQEINSIKEAVKRAEKAFLNVKPRIKAGVKEREIALRLEAELRKAGCRSIPFNVIIASGKNASMPHARPTEKKIEKGDFVIIDWGGEADGYYSDMTRTFLIEGKDLSEKIRIYNTVNDARKKAISSITTVLKTQDIDGAARNVIKKAGYGEFFGHGTGHGVGLDVHELPCVSWAKGEKIQRGMVFTIEPGIYIPEIGGVRIEDMVLVNKKAELLTNLSRDLVIIKN